MYNEPFDFNPTNPADFALVTDVLRLCAKVDQKNPEWKHEMKSAIWRRVELYINQDASPELVQALATDHLNSLVMKICKALAATAVLEDMGLNVNPTPAA